MHLISESSECNNVHSNSNKDKNCPSTDADSSCPDDINPITLDPPEVIGEYGDTVLVNCSSSEEFHDGLVLKLGNTYHNDNDDEHFVSGPLTLSDWSVTAECRIKLDETLECSRELGITIYSKCSSGFII